MKTYRFKDLEKYKGSEEESHEGKIVFAIKSEKDNKYYVYDVTEYSIDHPGGDEIMRDNSGTDATEEFNEIGHSASAMEELVSHRVGVLHDDDTEELLEKLVKKKQHQEANKTPQPIKLFIACAILQVVLVCILGGQCNQC